MPYADPARQRQFAREWVARRRAEWFDGKTCVECGSIERLELDHIDPADKVTHKIWSWASVRREVELAKCQVLCHFCHKRKTMAFMAQQVVHGTHSGYSYYGCRCFSCRQAHAATNRLYRQQVADGCNEESQ